MAAIYIHIPFCKKSCHYCNFHFSTSFGKKDAMINAIIEEINLQAGYLEGQEIGTIYFGGGTPSAIPAIDLERILETINTKFSVSPNAEITIESNPDDISSESLAAWRAVGFNRISIGIQAFQDNLLKAWNRSHSSLQAKESIALSLAAGFQNITADLIYGGQGLRDEDWVMNIQTLIDSGIPHISCYALTVETGTALFHQIETGKVKAPDDEQSNRQYALLQLMLKQNGFEQYEVSNFARPGMESRHNTSYWSGLHYVGCGPSAHSFNGGSRQWNVSDNNKYIDSIERGLVPFEKEVLTEIQQFNEIVMTGIRTSKGIDMYRVKELGDVFVKYLEDGLDKINGRHEESPFIKNGFGNWMLLPEYYFFADGIAVELFFAAGE